MKTICLLSYERAGTTWLSNVLNTPQIWSIFEVFSRNPALYYWNFLTMLKQQDCIPEPMVETFARIFHPQNMFVDALSYTKIKQSMLGKKPFSIDLLQAFQQEAYKKNKMLCFKIFPYHLDENIRIEDISNLSDYMVVNYRNNVLETFLSWKLAIKTGAWTSEDKQDRFAVPDVAWNEQEYLNFYSRICEYINFWKKIALNKPHTIIVYENIHQFLNEENKSLFIKEKLKEIGLDVETSVNRHFKKQRDYSDLRLVISNYDDFQRSLNNHIPVFYDQTK